MFKVISSFLIVILFSWVGSAADNSNDTDTDKVTPKTCDGALRYVQYQCRQFGDEENIRQMEMMNNRYKGVGSSVANQLNKMGDEQLRNAAALKTAAIKCKKSTETCTSVCDSEFMQAANETEQDRIQKLVDQCTKIGNNMTTNKLSGFIDSVDSYDQMTSHADKLLGRKEESFYEKNKEMIWGAGAIGGGVLMYNVGKNKGEKDGKKKAISNLRYNCFKEGKWDSAECKNEYKAVCSDNPKAEGCYAFTNSYCGINGDVTKAVGADTQFCDSMNSYRYCQQDGAANSPTCVERRVQAGTCQSDKAVDPSLECQIYNHQQLAQQICQSYPSDPLCRRVLSSGSAYSSTAPPTVGSASTNAGVQGYAMPTSSTSSVIPDGQRQPTSSSDVSCAACASVFSQVSRVAQEYCKTGQLYGCYKK